MALIYLIIFFIVLGYLWEEYKIGNDSPLRILFFIILPWIAIIYFLISKCN